MKVDNDCLAIVYMLDAIAGDVAQTEYWFDHDTDTLELHTTYSQISISAGASFCSDCVIIIESMRGLPSRDRNAWNLFDTEEQTLKRANNTGGCSMEHDSPLSCDWCGATLQYVLLGIGQEMEHWLTEPEAYKEKLSKGAAYQLARLFSQLTYRDIENSPAAFEDEVNKLKVWAVKWICVTDGLCKAA